MPQLSSDSISNIWGIAPTFVATIGHPHAIASNITLGNPSVYEGSTKIAAVNISLITSSWGSDPIIYNSEVNIKDEINKFVNLLKLHYNDKKIILYNERYTSKIAQYCISLSNKKKSNRRDKNEIDMISASLILNSYLDSIKFKLN